MCLNVDTPSINLTIVHINMEALKLLILKHFFNVHGFATFQVV